MLASSITSHCLQIAAFNFLCAGKSNKQALFKMVSKIKVWKTRGIFLWRKCLALGSQSKSHLCLLRPLRDMCLLVFRFMALCDLISWVYQIYNECLLNGRHCVWAGFTNVKMTVLTPGLLEFSRVESHIHVEHVNISIQMLLKKKKRLV